MTLQLQTRWICRTCLKEWVGRGNWSPVNVYNPETKQIEAWDEVHCVNPECRSTEIEPRTYLADRGMDIPRGPNGEIGGVAGINVPGFADILGVLPPPPSAPVHNLTMRLAEAPTSQYPDWVPE